MSKLRIFAGNSPRGLEASKKQIIRTANYFSINVNEPDLNEVNIYQITEMKPYCCSACVVGIDEKKRQELIPTMCHNIVFTG